MPRAETPLTDALLERMSPRSLMFSSGEKVEALAEHARSLELANRELLGLLEEARNMIGWPHWSGTEAEQCDAAKKLVERIDARIGGKE